MAAQFAGFEILGKLGEGGMGAVYKARQPGLDRVVALKVLSAGEVSEQAYARFKREIAVVGKLRHPNIVRLFQAGQSGGRAFFTMDYIEGETLAQAIRKAQTWEERERLVRLLATVARAVHYAHDQGIVHRDLKPSNIIIDKATGEPVITDFGLAKELGSGATVTVDGEAVGTAHYMPPEQAMGQSDKIGPHSDVYSLGAILYELLTGRPPFEGATTAGILDKVCRQRPIPPRKLNPDIPKPLETLCLACLAKNPKKRPSAAETVAADIERALKGEPVSASTGWGARWPAAATVCLCAVVLCVSVITRSLSVRPGSSSAPANGHRGPSREGLGEPAKSADRSGAGSQTHPPPQAEQKRPGRARKTVPLNRMRSLVSSYFSFNRATSHCVLPVGKEVWCGTDVGIIVARPGSGQTRFHYLGVAPMTAAADGEGRLWFGTWGKGVVCHERGAWRTYTQEDGLAENTVSSIGVDDEGSVWFWCRTGPPRTVFRASRLRSGKWSTYGSWREALSRFVARKGQPRSVSRHLAIDAEGRKWFAPGRGVVCLDGKACRGYTERDGLPATWVSAVAVDPRGRVWLATRGGVCCLDGDRWRVYRKRDGLADSRTTQLAIDSKGKVWVSGLFGRVSRIAEDGIRVYGPEDGIGGSAVTALAIGPNDQVWLGAHNTGVYWYDGAKWNALGRGASLVDKYVSCIAIEPTGRCWFGSPRGVSAFDGRAWVNYTLENGLIGRLPKGFTTDAKGRTYYKPEDPGLLGAVALQDWSFTSSSGGARRFSIRSVAAHVRAIAIDSRRRRWFGTYWGLSCFDGRKWKAFRQEDGLPAGAVLSVSVDARENVWVETKGGTVSRLADGKFETFASWETALPKYAWPKGRPRRVTRQVAIDAKGRRWWATASGLRCLEGGSWRVSLPVSGLAKTPRSVLAAGDDGGVWYAPTVSVSGPHRYRGRLYRFDGVRWSPVWEAAERVEGHMVADIAIDPRGWAWFAAGAGVRCFDGKTWRTWTTKEWLAGNDVHALAVDAGSNIWVGTTTGVSHIVLEPKE